MGMTDRLGTRLLTLGALSALGCTSGADVLLGHAPLKEGSEGNAPPAERICDSDFAGRPAVELSLEVHDPSCTSPCSLQVEALRVADDGSVWAAGSMSRGLGTEGSRERLWIGHYDAAGNLLGSAAVNNWLVRPQLALDDSEQAWLLALPSESQTVSHLYRFDASVHELEKLVLPGTYTDLISYPGHGVLLSGGLRPLTALSYEGEELWTSANGMLTGGRLTIADDGRIVLVSGKLQYDVAGPSGIHRFGPFGTSLMLDWLSQDGEKLSRTASAPLAWDGLEEFNVGSASDAGLTVVSFVPLQGENGVSTTPRQVRARITRLSTTGATKWTWLFEPGPDLRSTIDRVTGTTLVVGPGSIIVAFSPDGTSCRRFAFDGPNGPPGPLAVGPDGEIWFGGLSGATSSIVRLERPDLNW